MFIKLTLTLTLLAAFLPAAFLLESAQAGEHAKAQVNIYSYRKPELIQPMFEQFTAVSGISVNVVYAKGGMLAKLKSEGENSPADLVFTADIGRLTDIKNAALTQPVNSAILKKNIPANRRDSENHWFGLTARARIIVASKERVPADAITTYEQLSDPALRGKICTRSGKHAYMIGLTASMIAHHGIAETEKWLAGVKANLARKPAGNDRSQVKAISQGICDIAVINHYYMYKMMADPAQKPWADSVTVIFPNQQDRGAHINLSGMALTRHAPNVDAAIQLMEYLSSDKIQLMYAQINGEYAVKAGVRLSGTLQQWGALKQDNIALEAVAKNRIEASKMADRVDYDG